MEAEARPCYPVAHLLPLLLSYPWMLKRFHAMLLLPHLERMLLQTLNILRNLMVLQAVAPATRRKRTSWWKPLRTPVQEKP
mmetsp:Transcript_33504/g.92804  ORF Transcript_33504/g.92804 Transcript_33504/m.92804 type:complete len:81 (-) Transcript_33504:983-1225(-)